ncbi:MAG: fused MFS/spermidine synthase [Deltaproteobacteria bacterium]|nr:fused MFS/spermidine synthase [Deltaproteobacteria bacterium]
MPDTRTNTQSITLYGLTIFLSAFLLFQLQPLIGKHILPWFGGTPAVWTTCLLFFQLLLLGGYAYAHWLANLKSLPAQGMVHLGLLLLTLLLLPVIPANSWKPEGGDNPILLILGLLTVTVGGPYFMLTTTGPLLQAWFAIGHKGKSPYPLYALSNAGSLLGLITYPFLFEPLLARYTQAIVWSLSYGLFIFLCGFCARQIWKGRHFTLLAPADDDRYKPAGESCTSIDEERPPSAGSAVLWLVLSACGSTFLLSTTNQVTQNVAVIPFLWVLFLSVYLLTFILVFQGSDLYRRWWSIPLLLILSVIISKDLAGELSLPLAWQIVLYTGALFAGCLICHGELAKRKPSPKYLTLFFLMIAGGGALGGLCVAVGAPFLFPAYWEYHFILMSMTLVIVCILFFDQRSPLFKGRRIYLWGIILPANIFMATSLVKAVEKDLEDAAALSRNFYGVLKVAEFVDDNIGRVRQMHHGKVLHGTAYEDPPWRGTPTSYYGKGTGVWLAVNSHPGRMRKKPLNIGVIGLGTGTIAALANKGDKVRFYEINNDVITLSRKWFWYQRDSAASIKTIAGDARIILENELVGGEEEKFHILVADAFSGDFIPIHLLTRESAELYRNRLRDDGILAIHISNSNFDLAPVTRAIAEAIGWEAVLIDSQDRIEEATWAATWVLITANQSILNNEKIKKTGKFLLREDMQSLRWTDDYASLFHVLKFRGTSGSSP